MSEIVQNFCPFHEVSLNDTPLCMKWTMFNKASILALGLADGGLTIYQFAESSGTSSVQDTWFENEAHAFGIQAMTFCENQGSLYLATGNISRR